MKQTLDLSPTLSLPLDFATEGVAVIGMRGAGKTTTEVVWCEELDKVGIPFVVIEPKGDWGGIRSSADGKKPGLSVPVFGGRDGDGPLTANLGPRIADMLVDLNISAVLDLSNLSIADKVHFITEFCNRLMFRHQHEPHVRCVVLEEAHRYIPQQVTGPMAACKEAASAILLEGRAWGLGCWACTQRPARLHKDVLEEVGTALLHRLGVAATNDLKTVQTWMKNEGLPVEARESLTKLANGEAWVLAPVSLGIAERVQVRARRTFDSGATPLVGAKGSRPVVAMAQIDMDSINATLADVIEKAKAEDPRTLHARIRDLEKQLTKGDPALVKRVQELERELDKQQRTPAPAPQVQIQTKEVEVRVVPDEVWEYIDQIRNAIELTSTSFADLARMSKQSARLKKLQGKGTVRITKNTNAPTATTRPSTPRVPDAPAAPARTLSPSYPADGPPLKPGAKRMLEVLARQHPLELNRRQMATMAGIKHSSGTFSSYLSNLRTSGLIAERGNIVLLTEAGWDYLGVSPDDIESMTVDELVAMYATKLKPGARRMLDVIVAAGSIERLDLAAAAGIEPTSGTFSSYLSNLRTNGLVEVEGVTVRLGPALSMVSD